MAKLSRPTLRLSPRDRQETGLTATVAEQTTGELRTRVFQGTARPVEALAGWVDRLGPGWKVRTICTPASIFSDLVNDGRGRVSGGRVRGQQVEAFMLNRIGRGDLVEYRQSRYGLRTAAYRTRRRK